MLCCRLLERLVYFKIDMKRLYVEGLLLGRLFGNKLDFLDIITMRFPLLGSKEQSFGWATLVALGSFFKSCPPMLFAFIVQVLVVTVLQSGIVVQIVLFGRRSMSPGMSSLSFNNLTFFRILRSSLFFSNLSFFHFLFRLFFSSLVCGLE